MTSKHGTGKHRRSRGRHAAPAVGEQLSTVQQLQIALERVKEELQTAAAEYASANKVITASNEVLVSVNEELRTAGHRLEISKKELQSINDTLLTSNKQLESSINMLEALVVERAEQVKQLASELIQAEQRERQRIAQILHDDLQQLLHSVRLRVGLLSQGLSAEQAERLGHADNLISRALEITHTLTVDLCPSALEGDDFTVALEWLAIQMEDMHGLKVEIEASTAINLPGHLRSLLYQLVRELLFNVVKHAEINQAFVKVIQEDDLVVLVVIDEGSGFEPGQVLVPSTQGGFGLSSVRQRLDLLGGRLEVATSPGRGTRATIYLSVVA